MAFGEVRDKDYGEDEGAPLDEVLEGVKVRLRRLDHLQYLLDEVCTRHDEDAELTHPLGVNLIESHKTFQLSFFSVQWDNLSTVLLFKIMC